MLETERKYEAVPGAPLPDLRGLPDVASQSEFDEITLEAVYYDTATYDLARAGITLRRRSGGDDSGWHLKIPHGRRGTRTELRVPLEGVDGAEAEPPAELAGLLTARLRGRSLQPVATIGTHRRRSMLADADGSALAELALDTVTAEALGPNSSLTRWNEVEIELADGVRDGGRLLKAADRKLRRSGLVRSPHRMKLEVALAGALPEAAEDTPPSASATAGDVVLSCLRSQYDELLRRDMLVRRDEPDAIHRMRVSARRARAALQEFDRLFRGTDAEHLSNELRWLGADLGRARDEQVLRDLLITQLDLVPGESVLGPVRARLVGHYAPRLAAAERIVLGTLDSERYLTLLDTFEAFLAHPALADAAARRATGVLPHLVRRSQRRVTRRMSVAAQVPEGGARDSALHDARKAAKRARYAAEVASIVVGKKARKSAKALEKVQSELGDHHDAVIAADALRMLAIRAHAEGESAYTYGLLNERQNARAARYAECAEYRWRQANRGKRKAWMSK
jgi:CHAD domain-containing protein